MFTVNGAPILVTEMEVMEELRRQTILNGLNLFKDLRHSGHNIMTNCPFHKGGQERKPSFGVSKKDMTCHCFTCGWAGNLETMISNIFGYDDSGLFGRQWLAKNFISVSIEQRKPLNLALSRKRDKVNNTVQVITEEELDSYRYIHPYMYQRGFTDELIEEFDVGYDDSYKLTNEKNEIVGVVQCITFPVKDINGNVIFIARRGVNTKFFHYPAGASKPVYCAERVKYGDYSEAIICEGIIDAITCWKYGKPAVALIGTGTREQYEILKRLPVRKYIIATDPDEAGQRAAQRLRDALGNNKILTQYYLPEGTDLNDLQEEILNLREYL